MVPSAADPAEPAGLVIDDRGAHLTVTWADEHTTKLPYAYLRGLCPCAVCQGHGGDLRFIPPTPEVPLVLSEVLEVGHYALNMVWQDGHRTGIYALPYLRSLCLCERCRGRHGQAHASTRLPAAARLAFITSATAPAPQ